MNVKQKRFAEEYAVDHNATAAAIRAGYAEGRAKQTGHDLLYKPEVNQLVQKLDAEKSEAVGIDAQDALAKILHLYELGSRVQP
jgi:phage terminase small subunit